MADEIKKVISITVEGDQTVKSLKQEISDLRDALLNVEEGTEDYNTILGKLIDDQKQLTAVMNAGKAEVEAAAGSYNALTQEMASLKKVWKEVTDEASRNEIGARILEINNQLKDMDASIGNFQRNVGDYEGAIVDASKNIMQNLGQINPALGGIGKSINQLIPIIQKTTKVATTGLKGIKAAMVSTGIGALIVALGLLVANWDKVSDAVSKYIPWQKKSREETQKLIDANNELIESNKAMTEEMDFQARIMAAMGKSQLEIIQYKKQETEALLANTEAQIAETNAKIASIKAHSAFGRWIRGERKQLKGLEESLEGLVKEQEALVKSVKKYGQDLIVEQTRVEYSRTKTTKTQSDERISIEKYEAKSRLEELRKYYDKAKSLEESYYTEEEKIAKDFADKQETVIKGLYVAIAEELKDASIPSQVQDIIKKIDALNLPDKIKQKILSVFEGIDYSQSAEEITNQIRQGLGNVEFSGLAKKFKQEFMDLVNSLEVKEIPEELAKKLDEAFSNVNIEDVIADLKNIFGEDGEFGDIINRFVKLWEKVQDENEKNLKELNETNKKEYSKTLKENLNNILTENKTKLAKNKEEVESEKQKAREIYDASKQTYEDRKVLREAEYQANKRYSELEIQTLQAELDEYRRISNDELADDETRASAKEKVTELEISLKEKIRTARDAEMEKLKQDNEDEKAMLEERKENIMAFAEAIGDILGSIGDYWMDYVQDQVDAGKMSEEEGEKQFKWIKALQIAQTTIQTISAAMAAFNGITSSTGGWGIAAAAAEMAAVLTTGALQIAKIKNTHIKKSDGGSSNVASGAQVKTITTDFNPQYVAAQTGQSETDNLRNAIQSQPIWVSVQDINSVQSKVAVREGESTF